MKAAGGLEDPDVRRFKLNAYTGGKVTLPGFDLKVVFDLRSMWKNDGQVPLLLDHDFSQPVGHSNNVAIGEKRITGTGYTSVPGAPRDKVLAAEQNRFAWQLSVGGTCDPGDIELIPEGRSVSVNGRTLQGPFYLAKNYHLREISFVSMGADDEGATATLVAALAAKETKMKFADWLKAQNQDIEKLTAVELQTWRTKYDAAMQAQGNPPGGTPNTPPGQGTGGTPAATDTGGAVGGSTGGSSAQPVTGTVAGSANVGTVQTGATGVAVVGGSVGVPQIGPTTNGTNSSFLENQAREIEQFAQLQTLNAQFGNPTIEVNGNRVPLLAHAARNRFTPEQFELMALRGLRPAAPQTGTRQDNDEERVILQAAFVGAFIARAGKKLDHPFFGSETARDTVSLNAAFKWGVNDQRRQRWMEAAGRFRNYSMIDMVREAVKNEGAVDLERHGHYRNNQHWMRAAFSSMAVVDLFTQSMQAVLLATYQEQQTAGLDAFINYVEVPNFLLNERPRVLLGGNDFERLRPTGTAKDITMSTTGEAYKIARYAAMIRINDETLTNERFDVIKEQPIAMGLGASRIEPELFFQLLLTNPNMKDGQPFFKSGFNRRTGSAISDVNLEAAVNQLGLMKENGQNVNLEATHILHAKSKRFTVARLLKDVAATETSKANVLAGIVQQVYDARLDNGFTSPDDRDVSIAGEPGSWFLGDSRWPGVEMASLLGTNRQVQMDSGTMTEGQWGIWFAAKKDAGVAPLRRESFQKNEA